MTKPSKVFSLPGYELEADRSCCKRRLLRQRISLLQVIDFQRDFTLRPIIKETRQLTTFILARDHGSMTEGEMSLSHDQQEELLS